MSLSRASGWLGSGGGILALLAPKGLCPLCIAASGGLLSSVGLGFLAVDGVIRWVLPSLLALGLAGLAVAVRRHRRWWVLAAGAGGAVLLYAGWLAGFHSLLYGGMSLLLAASIANLWSQRHPTHQLVQIGPIGDDHAQA